MSDSVLSVQYRKFRYQAQSDIADHGYRTKCPPMLSSPFSSAQDGFKNQPKIFLELSVSLETKTCLKGMVPRDFLPPIFFHDPDRIPQ
jgi:hypothetical protein